MMSRLRVEVGGGGQTDGQSDGLLPRKNAEAFGTAEAYLTAQRLACSPAAAGCAALQPA